MRIRRRIAIVWLAKYVREIIFRVKRSERVIPIELDIKTTSKIVGDGITEDIKNSGCKHSISGNEGEIWLSLSTEADFPFALIAAE